MNKDEKYRQRLRNIEDFTFDASVSEVFGDMIDRSVPGYRTLIANIGPVASEFIRPDTNCYDLGCSHGAGALSIFHALDHHNVNIIAIDNAPAMVEQCQQTIEAQHAGNVIQVANDTIQNIAIINASFVLLNLTLQFIPLEDRDATIAKIYRGLVDGGACMLTEKIIMESTEHDQLIQTLHERFKTANQYSELEISQKRKALENVLLREHLSTHKQRLHAAGFRLVTTWFQCFNFVSILAIK